MYGLTSKNWAEVHESSWKEGGNILWARGRVIILMGKPTETATLSVWEHRDSGQTGREPAWDWTKPTVSGWQVYNLVFYGAPSNGTRICLWRMSSLWNVFPIVEYLVQTGCRREEFGSTSTWYAMLCWFSWDTSPHLNGDGGEMNGGIEGRQVEGLGGEEGWESMDGM